MKTWQDADKVLKKVSDQIDEEYLYGKDSIHAKYTEFIRERDRQVELENQRILEERLVRERARRQREENQAYERV